MREVKRQLPDGTLYLDDEQASLADELGVDSVASIFAADLGHLLRDLGTRANVLIDSSCGPLFLKRHAPGRGRPRAVAWGLVEWANHKRLSRAGIRTAIPVMAGVDHAGRSFFMTRGLPGEPLDDFLRRGRPPEDIVAELTRELAEVILGLHGAGLCHKDLYLCHVFMDLEAPPGGRLALIDLQRVTEVGHVRRRRWFLKDLAALAYSSVGLPLDDRDRLRFLSLYHRGLTRRSTAPRRRRLARRVWRRSCKLIRKLGIPRTPPPREFPER